MENEKDAAIELLCRPSGNRLQKKKYRSDQEKLCELLHYSPLLIKLVSYKILRRIDMAWHEHRVIKDLIREYKDHGLSAIGDDQKIDELRKTIVHGSIDQLEADKTSLLAKLRIFEEAEVPIVTVARLWDKDKREAIRLIEEDFARVSLVEYSAETENIRLHAIIRDYLLDNNPLEPADHEQLINAEGSDPTKYNPYMWRYFTMHLQQAQRLDMLRHRLIDPTWLRLWVESSGVDAVIDSCRLFNDPTITLLRRSLELSATVLRRDRSQVDLQLIGRFSSSLNHDIQSLTAYFAHQTPLQWNRSGLIRAESQFESIRSKPSGKLKAFTLIENSGDLLQVLGFNNDDTSKSHTSTIDVVSLRDQNLTSTALDYSLSETTIGVSVIREKRMYLAVSMPIKERCETQIQVIDVKEGALLPSSCSIIGECKKKILDESDESYDLHKLKQEEYECKLFRQTFQDDSLVRSQSEPGLCGKPTIITSSRSGKWIACGFYDNRLEVWEVSGLHIPKLCFSEFFQEEITALAISERQGQVVLAIAARSLHIITMRHDYSVRDHIIYDKYPETTALALVKSSQVIMQGMIDGLVICESYTDANRSTFVDSIQLPNQIIDLATSDDGSVVIAACAGNTNLHIWERGEHPAIYSLPNTDFIERVGLTADGKTAFCLSGGQLWVWDLSHKPPPNLVDAHKAPVRSIRIDEAHGCAYTWADDETTYAWDLATGQRQDLSESKSPPFDASGASDDRIEISGRDVVMWCTDDQRVTLSLDSEVTASAVTADGRVFVIGDRSGQVHILALRD